MMLGVVWQECVLGREERSAVEATRTPKEGGGGRGGEGGGVCVSNLCSCKVPTVGNQT